MGEALIEFLNERKEKRSVAMRTDQFLCFTCGSPQHPYGMMVEWNARKHGGSKRRLWRKIHIGIDGQTLEIRAIEVTSSSISDASLLSDFLNQNPPDQEIRSITADGAYDTRKCHDAIAARNAYAVIPPRKNAKRWKPDTPGAKARNEAVRSSRYLGCAL